MKRRRTSDTARDAKHDMTRDTPTATVFHTSLLCVVLFVPLGFIACPGDASSSRQPTSNAASVTNATGASKSETNSSNTLSATITPSTFDGEKAFAHVREQVSIGARPAGSPSLARARDYIIKQLKAANLNVTIDEFRQPTPLGERNFANIIAEIPGESADQLIIASHYDSKYYRDMNFVGANDGGSSTGVLIELARALAAQNRKPRLTLKFVFFDGEEAFCENWDDCSKPNQPDNTYGSRRYVRTAIERGELARIRALILLDLVGYKDLEFPRDSNSTSWIVDTIWRTAAELKHADVFVNAEEAIDDDHTPFLEAGVNAVDIIQLNSYPHWHTAEDTLDKISARSLQIVGDVMLASIPRIEERLATRPR